MTEDFELKPQPWEKPNSIGAAMVGGNGGRQEADFYPTPAPVTQALVDTGLIPGPNIWEPACGDGAMAKVLEAAGFAVYSTDLHARGYGHGSRDFLRGRSVHAPTIVTNPPFMLAKEFILRAARLPEVTWLALLLKANYWAAADRLPLWREHKPSFWLPLTWRVDFLNLGRPTMDVAWCIWDWRSPRGRPDGTQMDLLQRPGPAAADGDLFPDRPSSPAHESDR